MYADLVSLHVLVYSSHFGMHDAYLNDVAPVLVKTLGCLPACVTEYETKIERKRARVCASVSIMRERRSIFLSRLGR